MPTLWIVGDDLSELEGYHLLCQCETWTRARPRRKKKVRRKNKTREKKTAIFFLTVHSTFSL